MDALVARRDSTRLIAADGGHSFALHGMGYNASLAIDERIAWGGDGADALDSQRKAAGCGGDDAVGA